MNIDSMSPMAVVLCTMAFFGVIIIVINASDILQWLKTIGVKMINALMIFFTF